MGTIGEKGAGRKGERSRQPWERNRSLGLDMASIDFSSLSKIPVDFPEKKSGDDGG